MKSFWEILKADLLNFFFPSSRNLYTRKKSSLGALLCYCLIQKITNRKLVRLGAKNPENRKGCNKFLISRFVHVHIEATFWFISCETLRNLLELSLCHSTSQLSSCYATKTFHSLTKRKVSSCHSCNLLNPAAEVMLAY